MSREVIIKVLSEEEISQREEEAELLNEFDQQYKQYSFRKAVVSPYENMGELVRCKDCKYYEQWTNRKICMPLGSYYGSTQPNDYCSYAERKER